MPLPRDIDTDPDATPSGSTIVPVPRRPRVAVTRGVQISDLGDPERWATLEEEASSVVPEEALEDAAERAEAAEERGSALDAELQESLGELLRSLPPVATKPDRVASDLPAPSEVDTVQPLSLHEPGGTRLLVELALVVLGGAVVTGLCAAWVLTRIL